MAGQRNRFIELIRYFESLGISVNIGKNKARGNQGLFIAKNGDKFRIDISKNVDDKNILSIMLHEFAHYIHYRYDSSLKSLNFIFNEVTDSDMEELLNVTVDKVPKNSALILYNKKGELKRNIKKCAETIKQYCPDFKLSLPYNPLEKKLKLPVKYLLKYDKIIYLNKVYSVEELENDFPDLKDYQCAYIRLKSLQRMASRVNSRINRMNKYYNTPTELWARFLELFFTDSLKADKLAPNLSQKFRKSLKAGKIEELSKVNKILHTMQ